MYVCVCALKDKLWNWSGEESRGTEQGIIFTKNIVY